MEKRGPKKIPTWQRFERDVKVMGVFNKALDEGKDYTEALELTAKSLGISESEIKRCRARWQRKGRPNFFTFPSGTDTFPPGLCKEFNIGKPDFKYFGISIKPEYLTEWPD